VHQLVEKDERFKKLKVSNQAYRFINPDSLPPEAMMDSDYRIKMLERQFGNMNPVFCSKCHHCR
jgi:hypothetical protein